MKKGIVTFGLIVAMVSLAVGLQAQDEKALREAFEGRLVAPLLAMPATTRGVNVFPHRRDALDNLELEEALEKYGVGVERGQAIQITRIKVKRKHIEFQLGAGGVRQEPRVESSVYVGESAAERNLRDRIKNARSESEKKNLERELARLRYERQREEDQRRREAEAAQQALVAENTAEEWAMKAGARFNVRFDSRVPKGVMTQEGFSSLLARWVDFEPPPEAGNAVPLASLSKLRKGLTFDEVEQVVGKPGACEDGTVGDLDVSNCKWGLTEGSLDAQFVGGVLVKYTAAVK